MVKTKIDLLVPADERDEAFLASKEFLDSLREKLISDLRAGQKHKVRTNRGYIRCDKEAIEFALNMSSDNLVILTPFWYSPSIALSAALIARAKNRNTKIVLFVQDDERTPAVTNLLAVGGALWQAGIKHYRIFAKIENGAKEIKNALSAAAPERIPNYSVVRMGKPRLRRAGDRKAGVDKWGIFGSIYKMFGNFGLKIYTADFDPTEYARRFGVFLEHLDQKMLLDEAERIDKETVEKFVYRLKKATQKVIYDGKFSNEKNLAKQVRLYLAFKRLTETDCDFASLKCQPECSDFYADGCLIPLLIPFSRDAFGKKKDIPFACECDSNAALLSYIIKKSTAKQSAMADVKHIYNDYIDLRNCGSMNLYFSSFSESFEKNMKYTTIGPQCQGKAGGCAFRFKTKPGKKGTISRIYRIFNNEKRRYEWNLIAIEGEFVAGRAKEANWAKYWAQANFKPEPPMSKNELINLLPSNHMVLAEGHIAKQLEEVARHFGIGFRKAPR